MPSHFGLTVLVLVVVVVPLCGAYMQCLPFGLGGMGGGFPGYGGNYCGVDSIFHYYTCCDYNPTECCLHLEPWFIVVLVIVCILLVLCCVGCAVGAVWRFRPNRSSNYSEA
ncbi:hypothetical protein QR680_014024 [Steinernema hermaphroditum]|uniref:Uncharacterized protein n=1 Tax=Steinernema hermaphroditum TaxID=289476 RepID=A0AA39M373_9BILA|nr:hypothetical protein QR680_014024 [Steinernema hermaphroditum]